MLLEGKSRASVVTYITDNYGVAKRTADYYIQKAKKLIGDTARQPTEKALALGDHIARRRLLYELQLQSKDYRGARMTADSEARLLGLLVDSVEVSTKDFWTAEFEKLEQSLGGMPDSGESKNELPEGRSVEEAAVELGFEPDEIFSE